MMASACASEAIRPHRRRRQIRRLAASRAILSDLVPVAYDLDLPDWTPPPLEPTSNRLNADKAELGRRLFYDVRLSSNQTKSCASCHRQELAFTDGLSVSPGVTGQTTPRNSMSLANVAYAPVLTWANPLLHTLERQALVPLLGQEPVELGMANLDEELVRRLKAEPVYRDLFPRAFPETKGEINLANVVKALSAFERTLISVNSPYDRYRYAGDVDAISDSAIRGEALFFSEKFECHHCHNNFNLNDNMAHARAPHPEIAFHNTGLYNVDGKGGYPGGNVGIAEFTTGLRTWAGSRRRPYATSQSLRPTCMMDRSPRLTVCWTTTPPADAQYRTAPMPASAAITRSRAHSCPASR